MYAISGECERCRVSKLDKDVCARIFPTKKIESKINNSEQVRGDFSLRRAISRIHLIQKRATLIIYARFVYRQKINIIALSNASREVNARIAESLRESAWDVLPRTDVPTSRSAASLSRTEFSTTHRRRDGCFRLRRSSDMLMHVSRIFEVD